MTAARVTSRGEHRLKAMPLTTGAPGTTDAMQMSVGVGRDVEIDHHREIGDVEATCRNIGCDQHRATAIGEAHEHFFALALIELTVQGQYGEISCRQLTCDHAHVLARIAEHDDRFGPVVQEQCFERVELRFGLDFERMLAR